MMKILGIQFETWVNVFLTLSPVFSWGDMILSVYRNKSSAGFSLDLCGIMLFSSIFKVFFWLDHTFNIGLCLQAISMIFVQIILLQAALYYRPKTRFDNSETFLENNKSVNKNDGIGDEKYYKSNSSSYFTSFFTKIFDSLINFKRPFSIWKWEDPIHYWNLIAFIICLLCVSHKLFGGYTFYADLLGLISVAIEASLPLPQILTNYKLKSVRGFRFSLLFSWLLGDTFKIILLFCAPDIALQFKIFGILQTFLDISIGIQYFYYIAREKKKHKY